MTVAESDFRLTLFAVLPDHLTKAQIGLAESKVLERAGLLFARGAGSYGYVHRLFQEYLAACELIDPHPPESGGPDWPALPVRLRGLLHADPPAWREVTRFAAVRLARAAESGGKGRPESALDLVQGLLGPVATTVDDRDYQVALAGGLALGDLRAAAPDLGLTRTRGRTLDPAGELLDDWFLRLVDDRAPSPLTRRDFGRLMGRLGREPRPGIVPAAWTPDDTAAIPPGRLDLESDFCWVAIPGGPFIPGTLPGDQDPFANLEWERGGPEVEVPGFAITRYPVTWAQFDTFTRGGGYGEGRTPPPWWSAISPEAVAWWRENGGADCRPRLQGDRRDADQGLPNHPVEVTWFEAMAFCGWLSSQEQARRRGWTFRLPREVEWERAARGQERRRWPWGNDWHADACNSAAGLGGTTAVGLFPYETPPETPAAAPAGLRDLAGNCWEWTLSHWGPDFLKPAYSWSADLADGRDDPGGKDARVIRGGAWYVTPDDAPRWSRGAFRNWGVPYIWNGVQGVRVVRVSLAVSVY